MHSHTTLRPESPADSAAIDEVTIAAFQHLEISSHTEQFIITALRAAQALSLPEVFFALSFHGPVPQGTVRFHDAFTASYP